MKIKHLFFKNHSSGWTLKDIEFSNLSLLVGASGVGKTQILHAINVIKHIAEGHSYNGIEWRISFLQEGESYLWEGMFDVNDDNEDLFLPGTFKIKKECIRKDDVIVASRENGEINFKNTPLIKLDSTKSLVELLKEEDVIKPVYKGFKQIKYLREFHTGIHVSPDFETLNKPMTLDEIKKVNHPDPLIKIILLKKNGFEEFEKIKNNFIEIFPLVQDISYKLHSFYKRTIPMLCIKEKGVRKLITQENISSGMLRTLSQLMEMILAGDGDVLMIDEFENGLGINCIDSLAELISEPDADVQVIMTSHHPYIINTIPFENWKIVTRCASEVVVKTPEQLRIGRHSRHDAFMQLIQTDEYKSGKA